MEPYKYHPHLISKEVWKSVLVGNAPMLDIKIVAWYYENRHNANVAPEIRDIWDLSYLNMLRAQKDLKIERGVLADLPRSSSIPVVELSRAYEIPVEVGSMWELRRWDMVHDMPYSARTMYFLVSAVEATTVKGVGLARIGFNQFAKIGYTIGLHKTNLINPIQVIGQPNFGWVIGNFTENIFSPYLLR